jgi:hypothetical protein
MEIFLPTTQLGQMILPSSNEIIVVSYARHDDGWQ